MKNIEQVKQNHPKLIVDQIKEKYPIINSNTIREILKFTGVNKWLKNRRYVIQLKEKWKKEIAELQLYAQHYKDNGEYTKCIRAKERMNTLADCRQQLRSICHSNRETEFPTNNISFRDIFKLPDNFPKRPNTNYLKRKGL